MEAPITLLVVDGHPGVREALARRLRQQPTVGAVTVASTVESALRLARDYTPHIVLYDPRTMVGDACETIHQLAQAGRRVVVFTSSLLEGEAAVLRQAGATALLLKG